LRPATRLVFAAAAVLMCRMAASLLLVPPWQMADEQAHVAYVEVLRSRMLGERPSNPGREDEIIESMVRSNWWHHYYDATPPSPPLPARFIETEVRHTIGVVSEHLQFPPLYYSSVAAALAIVPQMSVTAHLYAMRLLSAALSLVTLWVAWMGARQALPEDVAVAIVALVAVHPQFVVASTSAGPDAFVNVLGAVLWWQVLRATSSGHVVVPLTIAWIAALAATFADRMGAPLVGCALVATVALLWRHRAVGWRTGVALVVAAASLVIVVALDDPLRRELLANWSTLRPVQEARSWDFIFTFHRVLFTSWWLSLGWARYLPPAWWTIAALILSLAIVFGLVRMFLLDARIPMAIRLAVPITGIYVAAVYWVFFREAVGPQGRHLFPVLVPTLMLFCAGWDHCVPPSRRVRLRVVLVASFAALDAAGWLFLAIPVYARG
jgi:hypothetical protein